MEQQQSLGSWRNLLASSKQRGESTIQSPGSAEPFISMLNAKSELTNAIGKTPLVLEPQTDSKLSVFFDDGYLMDMLKKAGEVSGDHGNSRPVSLSKAPWAASSRHHLAPAFFTKRERKKR